MAFIPVRNGAIQHQDEEKEWGVEYRYVERNELVGVNDEWRVKQLRNVFALFLIGVGYS